MIKTRYAPSPTGEIHIGALRTLLYNYAFAKHNNGNFILRIEDTDRKRYVDGAEKRILEDIKAFGINWDEGPFIQTERLDIYNKYIKQLLDKGHAYYCFCSPERLKSLNSKYDRHCFNLPKEEIEKKLKNNEPHVIRLKLPDNKLITFDDAIRGKITFNTKDLDDQVLIKSDGIPTYHFAVVVDDHLMGISHVMRGDEWISSTPKQILLYQYLEWEPPVFAHLTALLDPSHKGKMSKRSGSVFVRQFLEDGYLPEAILNYLMLLGWNPGDEREIFSLDEFIKEFSLERLHKSQPVFDPVKLKYFNGLYLRQKSDEELSQLLPDYDSRFIPLIKSRIATLQEAHDLLEFTKKDITPPPELINKDHLVDIKNILENTDFTFESLQEKFLATIKEKNYKTGDFFMTLRVAICGKKITPPVVESMIILGKEACVKKLYNININN